MLQTLPLVLFIVMAEVSIGAVSVLVFLDWRNEVKRGFLVSYALIYLVLAGLTYWFQQGFSTPALLNTYPQLDKAWTGYQSLPLLLFFLLLIPYSFFLLIDKGAGVQSVPEVKYVPVAAEGQESGQDSTTPPAATVEGEDADDVKYEAVIVEPEIIPHNKVIRALRLSSGVATVVAGLATLLVMAMIYRPLSAGSLGGVFTVAGFFAAAFALGGVLTAMWLGHWYLVTPALSGRPLQFSTTLVLVAIVAQVLFFIVGGSTSTYANQASSNTPAITAQSTPTPTNEVKPQDAPVVAPLSSNVISWIRLLVGFGMPLVLGGLAWKLIRDRSFQSATGMLYLVVVCTLAGEIMSRGLFVGGLL